MDNDVNEDSLDKDFGFRGYFLSKKRNKYNIRNILFVLSDCCLTLLQLPCITFNFLSILEDKIKKRRKDQFSKIHSSEHQSIKHLDCCKEEISSFYSLNSSFDKDIYTKKIVESLDLSNILIEEVKLIISKDAVERMKCFTDISDLYPSIISILNDTVAPLFSSLSHIV